MEDDRIRALEVALWRGEGSVYRERLAEKCIVVVPQNPFLLIGLEAQTALEQTPRWDEIQLIDLTINRVQEGLIVIGYEAHAARGEERFSAYCTTTYRRRSEHDWEVIQHQQTVPMSAAGEAKSGPAKVIEQAQSRAASERANEGGYQ